MAVDEQNYLRDVQYRFPDRLGARSILHRRYGRGDWFQWLAAHIPLSPGTTVADVGCGAGAFWTNAVPSVPCDLALRLFDISPGMVDAARASIDAQRRWNDVDVVVADAAALPMPNASVDTVIAIHMLYHLADPLAALGEMARITRRGGTIGVVLNPSGTMAELSALVREARDGAVDDRSEPLSSEQGHALMRRVFSSVDVVRYQDRLCVTDPVDLLGYLTSLPFADEPGMANRLDALVRNAFARADGAFTITKESELLLARR